MIPEHLSCRMLVEEATEWLEGGLDPDRRAELELHLVTCVGCTAYVEQLRQTSRALVDAASPADELPSDEVRGALLDLFRRRRPADPAS